MNGRIFLFQLTPQAECYRDPVERAAEASQRDHYARLDRKLDIESKSRRASITSPPLTASGGSGVPPLALTSSTTGGGDAASPANLTVSSSSTSHDNAGDKKDDDDDHEHGSHLCTLSTRLCSLLLPMTNMIF
jgi:hypothetical protein